MKPIFFLIPLVLVLGISLVPNSFALSYDITDTVDSVKFESPIESYVFDKSSCELNIYEGGVVSDTDIIKHTFTNGLKESAFGNPYDNIPMGECSFDLNQINQTLNVIRVGEGVTFETFYEFNIPIIEWTYKITNNDPAKTNHKYEIDFVCESKDCGQVKNNDVLLKVGESKQNLPTDRFMTKGGGILDTKNMVHGLFKGVTTETSDRTVFKFGDALNPLAFGETLIIDPIYAPGDWEDDFTTDQGWTNANANTGLDAVNDEFDYVDASSTFNNGYYNLGSNYCDGSDSCVIHFDITRNNDPTDAGNGGNFQVYLSSATTDGWFNTSDSMGLRITTDHTTAGTQGFAVHSADAQATYSNEDTNKNSGLNLVVGTIYYGFIIKDVNSVTANLCTDADRVTGCLTVTSITASGSQTGMQYIGVRNFADSAHAVTEFSLENIVIWDGVSVAPLYTPPPTPDRIDDLSAINIESNTLDLIWTEPGLNGGNITNYMINSTTPWSSATTFLANSTNLFYNVTGLNWGTDYSFSASVLTEGGWNFTGSVLNVTTTSPLYTGVAPTSLTVNDGDHSVNTILNLEWVADLMDNINGFRIYFETPIGNGFTTLTSNTTTTTLYYNDTGLIPGQYYNYKVAALNGTGISDNSTAYSQTPHKLPDVVDDLVITPNALLQFLGSWSAPTLYGTLNGYQINYTTPAGDPQTIYTSTEPTTSTTISGLNPTVEYSFRVAANTYHGINATGNIENATASSEIAVGDLDFDAGTNPDVEPIWYENYVVDSTTNNVQVRYDSALTVDCTITERVADNVSTYTGLSETAATGYVYHNFTVTNAGNDVLDWDCYDQTDSTINGQYALTQDQSAIGVGGCW
jgi:hypothetical protein